MIKFLILSVIMTCNANVLFQLEADNKFYNRNERNVPVGITLKLPSAVNSLPPMLTKRRTKKDLCNNAKILDFRNQVRCRARPTIVYLDDNTDTILIPSAVIVNKCNGVCRFGKCTATKTKTKKFYVNEIKNNQKFCTQKLVVEDKECTCECSQMATDCTNYQIYDKTSCKCICTNENEYTACVGKGSNGKYWDEKECACFCKEKICTTGTVWDKKRCKCMNK